MGNENKEKFIKTHVDGINKFKESFNNKNDNNNKNKK